MKVCHRLSKYEDIFNSIKSYIFAQEEKFDLGSDIRRHLFQIRIKASEMQMDYRLFEEQIQENKSE